MQHFFLGFVSQPLTFYDLLKTRFAVAAAAYFEQGVMRAASGAALMTRESIFASAAAANFINFPAAFFVNFKFAGKDANAFFDAFGFGQTFALGFGLAAVWLGHAAAGFGRAAIGVHVVLCAVIFRLAALFSGTRFVITHLIIPS